MAYRYFSEKSRLAQDRWNIRALSVCMVWAAPRRPTHHARRIIGYRDESLSSRYNSNVVTTGYHGFLRTALSHPCNDWICVLHVHSL